MCGFMYKANGHCSNPLRKGENMGHDISSSPTRLITNVNYRGLLGYSFFTQFICRIQYQKQNPPPTANNNPVTTLLNPNNSASIIPSANTITENPTNKITKLFMLSPLIDVPSDIPFKQDNHQLVKRR